MKALVAVLAGCMIAGTALAQTDDVKWVNQCIADSAGMNATLQVKTMYCTCMVTRMPDNETRSVTAWEQANPAIARDCARRAGWN
jgi:hypothetical protein